MSGIYSTILGGDLCSAAGDYSSVAGYQCQANGDYSCAFGNACRANERGYAAGTECQALGKSSVALGANNQALGLYSVSMGGSNVSWAQACTTFGENNQAGTDSPFEGDDGKFSLCSGYNNRATGMMSTAIGQSGRARSRLSFIQGEDSETLYAAQSGVAMNHFNTVGARAAFVIGCNNLAIGDGERSFAHGFSARATRPTQHVHAGGGFTPHSNQEDMFHTYAAGDAQTSVLVFRGETPGEEIDEIVNGGMGLKYSPAGLITLVLEPGRAYAIKTTAIVKGKINPGGSEDAEDVACMFKAEFLASTTDENGLTSADLFGPSVGSPATMVLGSASTSAWKFYATAYGTTGIGFFMEVAGGMRAATRISCKVEFTEVVAHRDDVAGAGYDMHAQEIVGST